jgi:hypothetical protein
MYDGRENEFRLEVRSKKLNEYVEDCEVENVIETLINLRYPCIAATIGVIFRRGLRELGIVGISSNGISLSEIVSSSIEWWTPTAKTKTIVSLVLGLRFVHSHGLLHGHLRMNDVQLKEDGMIEFITFQ